MAENKNSSVNWYAQKLLLVILFLCKIFVQKWGIKPSYKIPTSVCVQLLHCCSVILGFCGSRCKFVLLARSPTSTVIWRAIRFYSKMKFYFSKRILTQTRQNNLRPVFAHFANPAKQPASSVKIYKLKLVNWNQMIARKRARTWSLTRLQIQPERDLRLFFFRSD